MLLRRWLWLLACPRPIERTLSLMSVSRSQGSMKAT